LKRFVGIEQLVYGELALLQAKYSPRGCFPPLSPRRGSTQKWRLDPLSVSGTFSFSLRPLEKWRVAEVAGRTVLFFLLPPLTGRDVRRVR